MRAKFEEYLAKQKAAYKKRATLHGTSVEKSSRNRVQSISEYQTEVETVLDVEEEKAAEIKNPGSNGEDFTRSTATSSSHSVEGGG